MVKENRVCAIQNTPIPPSVKWHSRKDGPNCKNEFKAFSPFNQNIKAYIPSLLLSYRTVPHANRKQSPSVLMGRQISAPITMSFATGEKVWYKRNKEAEPERAKFILQKGQNTAGLEKKSSQY